MLHEFCSALRDAVHYGCTQPISMIVQYKLDEESRNELLQAIDRLDAPTSNSGSDVDRLNQGR